MTERITPALPAVAANVTPPADTRIVMRSAARLDAAVKAGQWKPALQELQNRLNPMLAQSGGLLHANEQRYIGAVLARAHDAAVKADRWLAPDAKSILELIGAILLLAIPFIVDAFNENAHETLAHMSVDVADLVNPDNGTGADAFEKRSKATTPTQAAFDSAGSVGGGKAKVLLLTDNVAAWAARWSMLTGAKHEIVSSYFSLERDAFGLAFLGACLKKQQQEKVNVELTMDTVASHGVPDNFLGDNQSYLKALVAAGSQVSYYNTLPGRVIDAVRQGSMQPLVASDHDKVLAVDGERSIAGGRNIGNAYLSDPGDMPTSWSDHDTYMQGAGPARGLVAGVHRELRRSRDFLSRVDQFSFGRSEREVELYGAYVMMDLWIKDPQLSDNDKKRLRNDPAWRAQLAQDLVTRAIARLPAEGMKKTPTAEDRKKMLEVATELSGYAQLRGGMKLFHPEKAIEARVKILHQTSAAGGRVDDFGPQMLAIAQAAQRRIVSKNPYLVMTEKMDHAFSDAARRGVSVTIGTNSPLSTDSSVTQAFFLQDWPNFLARVPGARIFVADGDRKQHSKFALADNDITLDGSYNWDFLSGVVQGESGVLIDSEAFNQLSYNELLKEKADPVNKVCEYSIARGLNGRALLQHDTDTKGKLVNPRPIVVLGPEQNVPKPTLDDYAKKEKEWNWLRNHLDLLAPIRHPALTDDMVQGQAKAR